MYVFCDKNLRSASACTHWRSSGSRVASSGGVSSSIGGLLVQLRSLVAAEAVGAKMPVHVHVGTYAVDLLEYCSRK